MSGAPEQACGLQGSTLQGKGTHWDPQGQKTQVRGEDPHAFGSLSLSFGGPPACSLIRRQQMTPWRPREPTRDSLPRVLLRADGCHSRAKLPDPRGKQVRPINHRVVPTAEAQRPPLSVGKVSHRCQGLTPAYCSGTTPGPALHTSPFVVSVLRSSGCSLLQREFPASEVIGSKGTDVSVVLTLPHCRCPRLMGSGYRVAPALTAREVIRVPRVVSGMPS